MEIRKIRFDPTASLATSLNAVDFQNSFKLVSCQDVQTLGNVPVPSLEAVKGIFERKLSGLYDIPVPSDYIVRRDEHCISAVREAFYALDSRTRRMEGELNLKTIKNEDSTI